MSTTESLYLKYLVRFVRAVFWLYRKSGLSDFKTSVVLLVITSILWMFTVWSGCSNYIVDQDFSNQKYEVYAGLISLIIYLGGLFFFFFYAARLRKLGIIGADAEIQSGLDYKNALARINDGFDLIGISGAKLTSHSDDFEKAIERVTAKNHQVRLLLCHPGCAIERLESLAGVNKGKYLATTKQSFTLLANLKQRFGNNLSIRLYKPTDESQFPAFRIMFINSELCLVSPNVPGAARQGRSLPQLHVSDEAAFGSEPTLYASFKKTFEQAWSVGQNVSTEIFDEIAQLRCTP